MGVPTCVCMCVCVCGVRCVCICVCGVCVWCVIVAKPSNKDDLDKLVKIAKDNGHDAKIVDQNVHVTGAADYSAQFNKSAFDAGIILESLTPIRPSLEDTFFEMTGD